MLQGRSPGAGQREALMSSSDARPATGAMRLEDAVRAENAQWAALSSQNERLVQPARGLSSTDVSPVESRPRWAELASQSDRLADLSDPQFGLASSNQGGPVMRPATGAA